jgi:hypothetical protein
MKNSLTYHKQDYFNDIDFYVMEGALGEMLVSKLTLSDNGYWYCNVGLQYKMTSIKCINASREIHGRQVFFKDKAYSGNINLFLEPNNIGVFWYRGDQVRKCGLANFWINIKHITFKTFGTIEV